MKSNRRSFIRNAAVAGVSGIILPNALFGNSFNQETELGAMVNRPKVLFFDVNETLLDLTAMKNSIGEALGGRKDLLPLWFTTMLQYSLVATVGNHYEEFGAIGVAALKMVAANNGIKLTDEQANEAVLRPLESLPPHQEVKAALVSLKKAGYIMVSFTNSSHKAVTAQLKYAGLNDFFDENLSIEGIKKFKPHADAYQWAAQKMNTSPKDCLLVAAHGWDIAGALWAGWQGAFVNRPGAQLYPLAPLPLINEINLQLVSDKLIALK